MAVRWYHGCIHTHKQTYTQTNQAPERERERVREMDQCMRATGTVFLLSRNKGGRGLREREKIERKEKAKMSCGLLI